MTPIEKYLAHLDKIFGVEPKFISNKRSEDGIPGVVSILYKDIPEPGFITGLTYGLSLYKHPNWIHGRPELCITVNSNQEDWGYVAGFLANNLRGKSPFCYGEIIDFGEQINDESDMSAFFLFAPSILDKSDFSDIDIGTDYKINIAGLYPIYADEIKVFNTIGLEMFWNHPNFDLYKVNRERITN